MCRLEAKRLAEAHDWLSFYERFWTMRLDDLGTRTSQTPEANKRSKR